MMYDSAQLNIRLEKVFRERYPAWRSLRMVVSSEPGGGKSTLLASVPVTEEKTRLVFDMEDSMSYLDAGKEGVDVYTPRHQQFRMHRLIMPTLEDIARYYTFIKTEPQKVGAILIDNVAVLQDVIRKELVAKAAKPIELIDLLRKFDAQTALPNIGLVKKWSSAAQIGAEFWGVAKEIPKQLLMLAAKEGIHLIASTEEANVWQNYGSENAKVVGKKARIWDVWYRHTDLVISLKRDLNKTDPPRGQLFVAQPKNRIQGLNPSWVMDWPGFIKELEEATKRTEAEVPKDAMVSFVETTEEVA